MIRGIERHDLVFSVGLSLVTVLSRLPYRTRMLYNWDAVQFALALKEYDIAKHQPHPPGYILYVLMGRLLDAWLADPNATYVTLAVVFSGLTTFTVYFLARAIYDRPTAMVSATLLAVSPLFWFYGAVGLTYAGEALIASTLAYFVYRALDGSPGRAEVAGVWLGLVGGVRQSMVLLLFPLWLFAAARGARPWRPVVRGLLLTAAAALSWFVPMVWLTGGLGRYLGVSLRLADSMVRPTTVGLASVDVTLAQARYVLESVIVGLGPLALALLAIPLYARRHGWGRAERFLLVWTLPPVLVYTFVHFGQAGYVLTFLPALVILLARVLLVTVSDYARKSPDARARLVAPAAVVLVIVLIDGSFFVSARPAPREFDANAAAWHRLVNEEANDWIWSRTAAALQEHEAIVRTFVDAIRGMYEPADTAIVTELGNPRSYPWLRHAMFYLSEYSIFQLTVDSEEHAFYSPQLASTILPLPESEIRVPARVRQLVWFVDHWNPAMPKPAGLTEIELPYGRYLYVLRLGPRPVQYAGYTIVRERPLRAGRAAR